MNEHVAKTIELVQGQIADLERQVIEKKKMVNGLCSLAGQPVAYGDAELCVSSGMDSLRRDEFYGKPLATVVRLILERRKRAGQGAATVAEIYEAMLAGGYSFSTKNDENAKRGLYGTLSKNSVTFHKLPDGSYGLVEWYPNVPKGKAANGADKRPGATAADNPPELELDSTDIPLGELNLDDVLTGVVADDAKSIPR